MIVINASKPLRTMHLVQRYKSIMMCAGCGEDYTPEDVGHTCWMRYTVQNGFVVALHDEKQRSKPRKRQGGFDFTFLYCRLPPGVLQRRARPLQLQERRTRGRCAICHHPRAMHGGVLVVPHAEVYVVPNTTSAQLVCCTGGVGLVTCGCGRFKAEDPDMPKGLAAAHFVISRYEWHKNPR